MAQKNILLLTSAREPGWIETAPTEVSQGLHAFIDALNTDADLQFAVTTLDRLAFSVIDGKVTITDTYTQRDLADYDAVHFRNVTLFADYARAITLYMDAHGKQVFERTDVTVPEYGKLSQMVLFAQHGLAVPDTWSAWHLADIGTLIADATLTFPFILKANNGIKGHDNYLVRDQAQFDEILARDEGVQFVAQRFIANDGDYRVLYFGSDEPLIFKRTAAKGSHLNNTSRGGSSTELQAAEFDRTALHLAERAARLTQRLLAGVDVIQDNKTGAWLVLEVNANPALSSGTLLERKVAGYKKMIRGIL